MIKLIASDMDGTLLDENSCVPPETFDLIRELHERGVHFVAGSGRRYDTLQELFAPVRDMIDYVASNGSQVYSQGTCIDREVYSHASLQRLIKVVNRFDCLHLVFFDKRRSFLLDDEEKYIREIDKDLPNAERVYEAPGPEVNIIKASIFCDDEGQVMDMAYALDRELGSSFVFAPSGALWIDAIRRGVSKAAGVQQLMDVYGIASEEVMAFGDAMNDYEILRFVGHSRAMQNGHYAIKQIAEKVIGPHTQQSVQKEIRALLDNDMCC